MFVLADSIHSVAAGSDSRQQSKVNSSSLVSSFLSCSFFCLLIISMIFAITTEIDITRVHVDRATFKPPETKLISLWKELSLKICNPLFSFSSWWNLNTILRDDLLSWNLFRFSFLVKERVKHYWPLSLKRKYKAKFNCDFIKSKSYLSWLRRINACTDPRCYLHLQSSCCF